MDAEAVKSLLGVTTDPESSGTGTGTGSGSGGGEEGGQASAVSLFDDAAMGRYKRGGDSHTKGVGGAHSPTGKGQGHGKAGNASGGKKGKKGPGSMDRDVQALLSFQFKQAKATATGTGAGAGTGAGTAAGAGSKAAIGREYMIGEGPFAVAKSERERLAYQPFSYEGSAARPDSAAAVADAHAAARKKRAAAAKAASAAAAGAAGGAFYFPALLASTAPIVSVGQATARTELLLGNGDV
jgi:hypothetical protein